MMLVRCVTVCVLMNLVGCATMSSGPMFVPDNSILSKLEVRRISGSDQARVCRVSVPVPRKGPQSFTLGDRATQAQPLGAWPEDTDRPRRLMLYACGPAEKALPLKTGDTTGGTFEGTEAELTVLDRRYDTSLPWEVNELILRNDDGELGLRVGLQVGEALHWWQWVRTETLDEGPVCKTIRAMGVIPVVWERHESPEAEAATAAGGWASYPWLHRHNHVRGEVLARCYANGVIELTFRHVNGRFFTEGGDVEGVVPVIGFRAAGGDWPVDPEPVTTVRRWHWDNASLNTADAAHLLSEKHPGRAWTAGDVHVYQPYEGVEVMAGVNWKSRTGDAYICRAKDRILPKGMGRTVRMIAAIGRAEPDVAVYLAPDFWYGLCEELCERPILPVRDHTWPSVEAALNYYRAGHRRGEFDDGAIPRGGPFMDGEPGWEGEAPQAQLIGAYLTGRPDDYDLALRSAYHLADVGTDKALFAVRMHGYGSPAQSLPMQRTMGMVAAYMETADPYLLDTARAVSDTAYWWDRHYWPRRTYGRDAAYIRSLVYLYRYLGEPSYLDKAREALDRLIETQRPDGSFNDQGSTVGIHAAMNLIVKPWMGCIATEAMIDYLEVKDDPRIAAAAMRFCDWLLTCRVESDRGKHWVYQVSHAGKPVTYAFDGTPRPLGTGIWHVEYLAKLMAWASLRTGDPAYYDAWLEAYRIQADDPKMWDHNANKILQNVTVQRSRLWNASYRDGKVIISPRTDIARDIDEAILSTPHGRITATMVDE